MLASETATAEMTAGTLAVVPDRVSPLDFGDIDCVCRTAKTIASATCSGCGQAIYSGVHLPNVAYGFFCAACCPCASFVPTPEEARAMARRRPYSLNKPEVKLKAIRIPKPRPVAEPARRQATAPCVEDRPTKAPWEALPAPALSRKSKHLALRVFVMKLGSFQGERQVVYDLIQDRMPVDDLYKLCAERGIDGRAVLVGLAKAGVVQVAWSIVIPT